MSTRPTILIIFGISGDLSRRYLMPAIEALNVAKILPEKFKLVGITRQANSQFYQMDLTKKEDYEKLAGYLKTIEKDWGVSAQCLFYLAVPPEACQSIIEFIGTSSLAQHSANKIILEKPFGFDLASAKELIENTGKYFREEQIYRVDHYLAKGTIGEMWASRTSDLYRNTWNKDFIKNIEIVASEKIGIEGRVNFYEQTGALRDFLQNHLLELLAFTLMRLPAENNLTDAQQLRYDALKNLNIVCDLNQKDCVRRAQYEGYRAEVGNDQSMTETFVSLNLQSNDPLWRGVPLTLTTGKALKEKFTKIRITFKEGLIDFNFIDKEGSLGAYGEVLRRAIGGEHSWFVSASEILETWRIVDPVQKIWQTAKADFIIYKKGSMYEDVLNL